MSSESTSTQELRKLRNDVDSLYKTVYQGNGSPSLTNQVTLLNQRLDSLEERIVSQIDAIDSEMSIKFDSVTSIVNERFNHISYQITHEFERTKIKEAGSHQLKASLVAATIAACSSFFIMFATHFIEYVKK